MCYVTSFRLRCFNINSCKINRVISKVMNQEPHNNMVKFKFKVTTGLSGKNFTTFFLDIFFYDAYFSSYPAPLRTMQNENMWSLALSAAAYVYNRTLPKSNNMITLLEKFALSTALRLNIS